jgi:hypothetical protein
MLPDVRWVGFLPPMNFNVRLLASIASNRLDRYRLDRYKHSSLFGGTVSDEDKKVFALKPEKSKIM